MPLEIRVDDDGRIEIEPAYLEVRVVKKGPISVAVPLEPVEPLTNEAVRQTQLALRERRAAVAAGADRIATLNAGDFERLQRPDVVVLSPLSRS